MPGLVWIAMGVAGLLLAGFALNRAAWWAEERGWVYNKHNPRPPGAGTIGLLEQIDQPSIEHVIEERASERRRGSQDESGDKPEAGYSTGRSG